MREFHAPHEIFESRVGAKGIPHRLYAQSHEIGLDASVAVPFGLVLHSWQPGKRGVAVSEFSMDIGSDPMEWKIRFLFLHTFEPLAQSALVTSTCVTTAQVFC